MTNLEAIAVRFGGLAAWFGVALFWFIVTQSFHPTLTLALIVTVSLISASAVAAFINEVALIPKYWRTKRFTVYVGALFAAIALVTAAALVIIRVSYFYGYGPDADPLGAYKHFAIDYFGVGVHVGAAAIATHVVKSRSNASGQPSSESKRQR